MKKEKIPSPYYSHVFEMLHCNSGNRFNFAAFLFGPFHLAYHQFWNRFIKLYLGYYCAYFITDILWWMCSYSAYYNGNLERTVLMLILSMVKGILWLVMIGINIYNGFTFNRKYYEYLCGDPTSIRNNISSVINLFLIFLVEILVAQAIIPGAVAKSKGRQFEIMPGTSLSLFTSTDNKNSTQIANINNPEIEMVGQTSSEEYVEDYSDEIALNSDELHELFIGIWIDPNTNDTLTVTKDKIDGTIQYKPVKDTEDFDMLELELEDNSGDEYSNHYIWFLDRDTIIIYDSDSFGSETGVILTRWK